MEHLQKCVDELVATGVQAYIGLLCAGEIERSRRVLSDTMQISSLAIGGPSARLPLVRAARGRDSDPVMAAGRLTLARCLMYFTLRSLLASLLVLRATAYWRRVPALGALQNACAELNRCLGEGIPGMERSRGRCDDEDDAALCACER